MKQRRWSLGEFPAVFLPLFLRNERMVTASPRTSLSSGMNNARPGQTPCQTHYLSQPSQPPCDGKTTAAIPPPNLSGSLSM